MLDSTFCHKVSVHSLFWLTAQVHLDAFGMPEAASDMKSALENARASVMTALLPATQNCTFTTCSII